MSTVEPSLYGPRFLKFIGDMFENVESANSIQSPTNEKEEKKEKSTTVAPSEIQFVAEDNGSLDKKEKPKTKVDKKKKKEKK